MILVKRPKKNRNYALASINVGVRETLKAVPRQHFEEKKNMEKQTSPMFACAHLMFLLLILHPALLATAQEVEDEREFDYGKGSMKGPGRWGELKKEWGACKKGNMQSPIDLSDQRVKVIPNFGDLKWNYRPANASVKNRGHDIAIQWLGRAGSIQINGTNYLLQQCHWHSPSEHSINGRRFDLELHMVHVSRNPDVKSRIAVVGLLYNIGKTNRFLSKLTKHIDSMTDKKEERHFGLIDPRQIKISGRMYYRYMGSLTVPPCTEGVTWIINKRMSSISRNQVKLLREAVHDYAKENARPLQPYNLREVHLYGQRVNV